MTWVLTQTARDLVAVHIPVDGDALDHRLPAGVVADRWDGHGWVTVVAMRMVGVRPRFLPAVPGLSSFAQVGVRAFVRAEVSGEPAVTFLALDVSSRLVAAVGRALLALPYGHTRIDAGPGHVRNERVDLRWTIGATVEDDDFLAERNVMLAARRKRVRRSEVRHPPVTFTVADIEGDLVHPLASVGLAPAGEPVARACPALPSHVGPSRRVRPTKMRS